MQAGIHMHVPYGSVRGASCDQLQHGEKHAGCRGSVQPVQRTFAVSIQPFAVMIPALRCGCSRAWVMQCAARKLCILVCHSCVARRSALFQVLQSCDC